MTRSRLLREVSMPEWLGWVALYELEHDEREREARRAKSRSRR